jgi:hypothetical protein
MPMDFPRRTLKFLFLFLLLPAALYARDITITVEDDELDLPLEGAVISLRSGQQFVCDEDGNALISLNDDRQQTVQISYPGYETKRLSIPPSASGITHLTTSLRLSGVLQGRELVLEAQRPETSETKSGRSVVISERELERTAEIGIIEDVMNSVKLLPGVGYTGMFGAMPSIRGGDPGDLVASFDGFYLERPYHWVGSISIFDPKMVSSARLSHGVFSSRYGHTISGLLEVTSKSPSTTEVEMETAISTSATSLNLSYPLNGKGGILFMGKVTYWDTLVWGAQGLSRVVENETLDQTNSISTAPYIRSAALSANYRFNPDLEWRLNSFFGSDGVGAKASTEYDDSSDESVRGHVDLIADYNNYQGFLISGITASPSSVLALKLTGGVGFIKTITDDIVQNDVTVKYNKDFLDSLPFELKMLINGDTYTAPDANIKLELEHTIFNAQGRADMDWDLGNGFIAAFGVQELYSLWQQKQNIDLLLEFRLDSIPDEYRSSLPLELQPFLSYMPGSLSLMLPKEFNSDIHNQGFTTSGYSLIEYASPNQLLGAELGLRVDHLYFKGSDFTAQTRPAFNPRLNIDFNILKNKGSIDSLDFTVGTGLFSSINNLVSFIEKNAGIGDYDLKFNRSWTSIAGVKVDLEQGYSFNIEGYYKYIFDRAYVTANTYSENIVPTFNFDGVGNVWGFDLQLQKLESRYLDGWISYTFTWAKYYDPEGGGNGVSMGNTDTVNEWYYPSFHRFHNCNIVLNIKPVQWFNISTRFGFASGQLRSRAVVDEEIRSYPVLAIDEDGNPTLIQKYRREKLYDVSERASWSLPWDIKFSFFRFDRKGRVGTEIYLAIENLTSLFYNPTIEGNTRFNEYTGKEDPSSSSTSFDFPIPMISFGFKWRY